MKCNSIFWIAFFSRSTVKLLVEILSKKVLLFDVDSFPQCGPLADRWDVVVSKKEKKGLHPQFSALKWNLGPLDGLVVSEKKGLYPKFGDLKWKLGTLDGSVTSPKITKRSSTIIRGLQMESGALQQLRESLTSLLRVLRPCLLIPSSSSFTLASMLQR